MAEAQLLSDLADRLLVIGVDVGVLQQHRHALDALVPHRLRSTTCFVGRVLKEQLVCALSGRLLPFQVLSNAHVQSTDRLRIRRLFPLASLGKTAPAAAAPAVAVPSMLHTTRRLLHPKMARSTLRLCPAGVLDDIQATPAAAAVAAHPEVAAQGVMVHGATHAHDLPRHRLLVLPFRGVGLHIVFWVLAGAPAAPHAAGGLQMLAAGCRHIWGTSVQPRVETSVCSCASIPGSCPGSCAIMPCDLWVSAPSTTA